LVVSVASLVALGGSSTAIAEPVDSAKASSFAITADVLGTNATPPTPTAEVTAPAADEVNNTVVSIPGDPLVVSGTLIAKAVVHSASDLTSELNQSTQPVAGPYNARAIGQIQDLNVLINEGVPGGQFISAGLVRAEAVAVCRAGAVQYSANSEVVDLQIAGEDPISGELNDALAQIADDLAPLADLVKVDLNVVTPTASGVSVDAVVITLLQAAGENGAPGPLVKVVLGHAELSGASCAAALPSTTECSDNVDNADTEDTVADTDDPGCHTDGDATNPASYVPSDDDESNTVVAAGGAQPAALPSTGTAIPTVVAAGLGIGALSLLALRRRLV